MTRCAAAGQAAVAGLLVLCAAWDAPAQDLVLDVSAGQTEYEALSSSVRGSNLIGTLRYRSQNETWLFGSAGAPLNTEDPLWGAGGIGGRLLVPMAQEHVRIGIELAGQGYLFRDAVVDRTGTGGTIDALPFVRVSADRGSVEFRGGWRGHTLSYADVRESRGVMETGVKATYDGPVRLQGEGKWVQANEGGFPFVGATLIYPGMPLQVWLQAGKWLSDDLDDVSWGAGAAMALGYRASLWTRAWQEAPEPLYWNVARRSWSIGLTTRLGRRPPLLEPVTSSPGGVVIAIPVSAAPGAGVSIAGDFTGWQLAPMEREGSMWVVRLPIEPGVYRYAFRSDDGRWFVPESVAGRRDDGMGGHVAVLVVG